MKESDRNAEFPVHIDLGKTMKESSMGSPVSDQEADDKKKYYPTLYISDAPKELADLPDEGCVLIKYKRKSVTVRTDADKKGAVSLDLEVQGICLPEDMKEVAEGGEEDGDMDSVVDSMAKKAGVIGGKKKDASGEKYGEDDEAEQP